jgi:hypothetical protein
MDGGFLRIAAKYAAFLLRARAKVREPGELPVRPEKAHERNAEPNR